MGLLARAARQDAVGGNGAHDEFGPEKSPEHGHQGRMGRHLGKHPAFGEQVPHAALQVDAAVGLRLALEMGDLCRLVFGMTHDNGPRIGDLLRCEQAADRHRAGAVEQLVGDRGGIEAIGGEALQLKRPASGARAPLRSPHGRRAPWRCR